MHLTDRGPSAFRAARSPRLSTLAPAALALALILAGARLSSAGVTAHLVVLLDDSASMAAIDGRGESARERAIRRVLAELERLGSDARVSLITSGDREARRAAAFGCVAINVDSTATAASYRVA